MKVKKADHRGSLMVLLAVCFMAALTVTGCSEKEVKAKEEKVFNVKTWTTEKKSVRPHLETVGSLKANDEVTVSAEVDGILKSLKVDEGTPVTRGMTLAVINDTDYRLAVDTAEAGLRQAEANLANTRQEYDRKSALLKESLVTRQQFDDISTRLTVAGREMDRAKALLSLAREKSNKTVICSPIQGIVKQKMVTAGDFARAGMPILKIVQIDPLKLSFTVPEKDIGALKVGQDVIFTADPYPGKEFSGRLTIIYPSLDERSRTLQVEAAVPNASLQLKPGIFTRVKLYTSGAKDTVLVPITSLLYEGTSVKAFVMEGDRAREKQVKTGMKYGETMEILEGLKGGEQLIVVGQNQLTEGVKVHAIK
jgi:membrane fusion protein, multidrug efflux system